MLQAIEAMFHQNVWANLKLIEACEGLDDAVLDATVPGTYGSVRATLTHLVRAEAGYYGRLTGEQYDRSSWGDAPTLAQLKEASQWTGEGLLRQAARVQASDTLSVQWDDKTVEFPASVILVQAINHATEHRAHIATILTQQDVTPPEIDGWSYLMATQIDGAANV
ncbi:MAG TPA: DinB family protein [Chloroflexia bacterium]|jgi:uncharacterized damage-inducible protein DinB|nr:DinB family protein [Chloroflexia bacterium]